jgi:hypothetical protein
MIFKTSSLQEVSFNCVKVNEEEEPDEPALETTRGVRGSKLDNQKATRSVLFPQARTLTWARSRLACSNWFLVTKLPSAQRKWCAFTRFKHFKRQFGEFQDEIQFTKDAFHRTKAKKFTREVFKHRHHEVFR